MNLKANNYKSLLGQFGIRLENIIRVVEAKTKYNFFNRGYLKFEDVTFVPIHQAMIETKMLTTIEVQRDLVLCSFLDIIIYFLYAD